MLKKIVISPSNKGAISFFEEIAKRKAEIKKRLEKKASKKISIHKRDK